MAHKISKTLRRYNYLFGETGLVYHEMYLKLGLSDSAASILYVLLENGDCCLLRDVCLFTGLNKQTINSALRKLEAEDILYLEMAGGKKKLVRLTEKGKILAERTAGRILAAEDEIFASWPRGDVEKYLELTEAFMLALKEKAEGLAVSDEAHSRQP